MIHYMMMCLVDIDLWMFLILMPLSLLIRNIMMKYIIDRGCPLFICKVPPTAKDDDESIMVRALDVDHNSHHIWYNVMIICILCLILLIIFISNYAVNQHYDKRKKISA